MQVYPALPITAPNGGFNFIMKQLEFYHDAKLLRTLYLDCKMSTGDIAKIFGCTDGTIWRRLKGMGINRNLKEAWACFGRHPNYTTGKSTVRTRSKSRKAWVDAFGAIPRGHVVHHIDFDPTNNALENLQILPYSEHTSLHMKRYWKMKKNGTWHKTC